MKKILEILRGARRIEILLALVALAILLLQFSGDFQVMNGGTDLERRLAGVLSRIEGVGRVEVMVAENSAGEPEGVLVVAQGADDVGVCLRLQYAVQTLLGTEAARIEVVEHAR